MNLMTLSGGALAPLVIFLSIGASPITAAQGSGRVSGIVVDQPGGAVAGARVTLLAAAFQRTTATDAKGEFSLAGVAVGQYTLQIARQLFEVYRVAIEVDGAVPHEPLRIVLKVPSLEEEVTVTATRGLTSVLGAPASVTVLTRTELETRNISRVGDALKDVVGIYLRGNAFGDLPPGTGTQSVAMRGLPNASRNLMLIDGNPINSLRTSGINFGIFDMDNASRVEVVRGAFSSLYGGNALGGVINLITPTPQKRAITPPSIPTITVPTLAGRRSQDDPTMRHSRISCRWWPRSDSPHR